MEARSVGSSNKYLEVALLTDDYTAKKYGESKISTLMLTIGNIVSVLCFICHNFKGVLRCWMERRQARGE